MLRFQEDSRMDVDAKLKIALVAPLIESVPPKFYGGTERIVSYLAEELVRQGHDVTLFASGDSVTQATLVPAVPQALRLAHSRDPLPGHMILMNKVIAAAARFDVIHFHIDYLHFPISRSLRLPQLSTLHGRLDLPDLPLLYREFPDMPLVSISHDQRQPLAFANWTANVYHGLPVDLLNGYPRRGDYLAFLGRISPEKGVGCAIEIAKRVGMELRIAAKIDVRDAEYYEQIKPLMDHPLIRYVGEINENEKEKFLGEAYALLFPIDWPEPFGLVMIESMACDTPVVAFRRGSVPEVIEDGVTGYIVDDVEGAVRALERLDRLDRGRCRAEFEKRFTARRMAEDYVAVYRKIAAREALCKSA
jgi:glycosyltransferase involved in cell wall biosynthesis